MLEEMLENDYSLGGEQSGHIIFPIWYMETVYLQLFR